MFVFADESGESAILTRPIKDYLADSSDIDVMFGYTSAVNELFLDSPFMLNLTHFYWNRMNYLIRDKRSSKTPSI